MVPRLLLDRPNTTKCTFKYIKLSTRIDPLIYEESLLWNEYKNGGGLCFFLLRRNKKKCFFSFSFAVRYIRYFNTQYCH